MSRTAFATRMARLLAGLALRRCSREFVRISYAALLAREADPVGMEIYASLLSKRGDLLAVLQELAHSEEHWDLLLARRAHQIVDVVEHALMDAKSTRGLAEPAVEFARTRDLGQLLSAVSKSPAHWKRQVADHSTELVQAAFSALLGRDADTEALREYSNGLTLTGDVGGVLRAIGESQEHWLRQVAQHAEPLAREIFGSLLGREPTALELKEALGSQERGGSLEALLTPVVRSPEHWEQLFAPRREELLAEVRRRLLHPDTLLRDAAASQPVAGSAGTDGFIDDVLGVLESEVFETSLWRRRSVQLIDAVYRGLFSRPADENGLTIYGPIIDSPAGLEKVLRIVGSSDELRLKARQPERVVDLWQLQFEHVDRVLVRLAGRRATLDDGKHCIREDLCIGVALKDLLRDSLPDGVIRVNRPVKVLLFGAFGNGNLGDVYQALAVRDLLMRATDLSSDTVFATSYLGDHFPFPAGQKLPRASIVDADIVNEFDALLIGGGGLLAHPHDPLMNAAWVSTIHVPILLLGVGASVARVPSHRALLQRAWFVSGRDVQSLAALRSIRADAVLMRDPIVCLDDPDVLFRYDADADADADEVLLPEAPWTLWVLKHPTSPGDQHLLDSFVGWIATQQFGKNHVVAIEPHLDGPLEHWFAGKVEYVATARRLMHCMRAASRVVSMRFHGAIFAALAGRPSLGCSQPKIRHLYEELGLAGRFFDDPAELIGHLESSSESVRGEEDRFLRHALACGAIDAIKKSTDLTVIPVSLPGKDDLPVVVPSTPDFVHESNR